MSDVSFALQSGGHASVLSGAGGAWSMLGLAGGTLVEEKHIRLDPLGVEDARGQTQQRVHIALLTVD